MTNLIRNCFILQYVYYIPLHHFEPYMLNIRRLNCIDAASGIVTLRNWPSGAQVERERVCWQLTSRSICFCSQPVNKPCFILQYVYYNPLHVSSIICSSSGGWIVLMQHLVSSLSVSGHPVHRLRENRFADSLRAGAFAPARKLSTNLALFYNTFIIILYMFRA